jgi:hypothetical protein
VFEPVNVLMRDPDRLMGYDMTPVKPLAARLEAFYQSIQPPGADPGRERQAMAYLAATRD